MNEKQPKTRTEANAPEAVDHLSEKAQRALEASGEAEHETGTEREQLTHAAKKAGEEEQP